VNEPVRPTDNNCASQGTEEEEEEEEKVNMNIMKRRERKMEEKEEKKKIRQHNGIYCFSFYLHAFINDKTIIPQENTCFLTFFP
jgi:hypothetical protein